MDSQTETKPDVPQGPAKLIGRVVGIALILMAVAVGLVMFVSQSGSSTSSDSGATQQSPPSSDDDALRKSLGGK